MRLNPKHQLFFSERLTHTHDPTQERQSLLKRREEVLFRYVGGDGWVTLDQLAGDVRPVAPPLLAAVKHPAGELIRVNGKVAVWGPEWLADWDPASAILPRHYRLRSQGSHG